MRPWQNSAVTETLTSAETRALLLWPFTGLLTAYTWESLVSHWDRRGRVRQVKLTHADTAECLQGDDIVNVVVLPTGVLPLETQRLQQGLQRRCRN